MLNRFLYPILFFIMLFIRWVYLCLRSSVRFRTTPAHEGGIFVFMIYLCVLGYFTINIVFIIQGRLEPASHYNLHLFVGIKDVIATDNLSYIILNLLGNVILFAPLGFFLPLLWKPWFNGWRVMIAGVACSGAIETLQFFTGRIADVDDVLLNTIGVLVGYLGYRLFRSSTPKAACVFRPRLLKPGQEEQRSKSKKTQRERTHAGLSVCLIGCVVLCGGLLLRNIDPMRVFANRAQPPTVSEKPLVSEREEYTLDTKKLTMHSENMILLSLKDNTVIYEMDSDQRIYPASMTKIMTAMIVLENLPDLSKQVFLREEMFHDLYTANAATAGFLPGEEVAAIDLLYGVMLPSGAECSVALAEHIAGSEAAFAELMNEKAAQLGLKNTHFVNATGLHHKNHYSTVDDISKILIYALENAQFQKAFATERYRTSGTNLHPDGITFYSTMFHNAESTGIRESAIQGGKTGYTDEAGQCLASIGTVDGENFLLVTAGARPEDRKTQSLHVEDAIAVYAAIH